MSIRVLVRDALLPFLTRFLFTLAHRGNHIGSPLCWAIDLNVKYLLLALQLVHETLMVVTYARNTRK
jgi:hypothetical protein